MNYLIYFLIFFSKVIENALATLRLIVVSNGKKTLGAFLQLATSIVWILGTSVVIVDISKDPLKIVFFGLGTFMGSYIGSFIEEKIAFGNNMITIISSFERGHKMIDTIRFKGYIVTVLEGTGLENKKVVALIMIPRKKRGKLIRLVKKLDHDCMIIGENAFTMDEKIR